MANAAICVGGVLSPSEALSRGLRFAGACGSSQKKAGVAANTVTRVENGADAKQSTMDKLQRILEAAGVEFTNGDQPGSRLTRTAAARDELSKATVVAKSGRGKRAKAAKKNR